MVGSNYNLFAAHLWREWRQHRKAIGLLTICILLAIGIVSFLAPRGMLIYPDSIRWTIVFSVAVVGLSIGGDLFAPEHQQGTSQFLRRIPGGLSGAFGAKLAFFVLLVFGAVLLGGMAGYGALVIRHGGKPMTSMAPIKNPWIGGEWQSFALSISVVLLWGFAVSSWVRSGVLTLPATLLFLAGMLGPVILLASTSSNSLIPYDADPVFYVLVAATLGAIPCAFLAFVLSGRRGWSGMKTKLISLILASAFFTPSWAWAGNRYAELKRHDSYISEVFLGEGSRFAFITVTTIPLNLWGELPPQSTSTAVLLNLESGVARRAGSLEHSCWKTPSAAATTHAAFRETGWPVVALHANKSVSELESNGLDAPELFDGAQGSPLECDLAQRMVKPWGGVDWLNETEMNLGTGTVFRSGTGFVKWDIEDSQDGVWMWDPVSNVRINRSDPASPLSQERYPRLIVLRNRWLGQTPSDHWELVDPVTGDAEALPELDSMHYPLVFFEDGSIVISRLGELLRFWPESGRMGGFEFIGFNNADAPGHLRPQGMTSHIRSSRSKGVVFLNWGQGADRHEGIAIVDPQANTIELKLAGFGFNPWGWVYLRGSALGSALIQKGMEELYWLDAESGELELVFDLQELELGLTP